MSCSINFQITTSGFFLSRAGVAVKAAGGGRGEARVERNPLPTGSSTPSREVVQFANSDSSYWS